jgi:cytosine/adenosine deaminase-related metal-dependent hydrolase
MASAMQFVSGSILTVEGFIQGSVGFDDGRIIEVSRGDTSDPLATGIVTPTFVNAHTHIADYVVPVDLRLSLHDLVAPPHGLKHRVLESTRSETLHQAAVELSDYMVRHGTSRFIDFREGGLEGTTILDGLSGAQPVIMARPLDQHFQKEEAAALLKGADGIGVSSLSAWDYEELKELAAFTRRKGKMFAIHASERVREDVGAVLDLKPSFIVHMNEAWRSDLDMCAAARVPIVSCPRSNLFFGHLPRLSDMLDLGITVALGTDNAMVSMPDMYAEIEFAGRILRHQGRKDLNAVLDMAFSGGRKILNGKATIGIEPGAPCDFMVTRSKKGNAVTDLVLRSNASDTVMVCLGEKIWRT